MNLCDMSFFMWDMWENTVGGFEAVFLTSFCDSYAA